MASRGSGLVRRVAASFERLVLKREAVGTDTSGNTYYRKFEPDRDGVNIERRWVKCPGGLYDPLTIPPEWSQWLKKARGEAPTPEEVAEREMWRLRQKQRAAAIDAEEAKRKFKAASLGEQSEGSAAGGPNMDRFVQQLTGKGYAQEQSTKPAGEEQWQGGTFMPRLFGS
ncbi:hypothetical protein WJX72_005097 [[Myrmecia] bisecta]|uniref:NADH dehydrogenase [ubiquinone] 1 alpha subcomplex subunit 12 n=1 Tax=[Myrmecia] bisecta TaxID=41462 RepID=A0AAW1PEY7_9CHLO